MTFPKRRRNWKRVHATNLREAMRLCKDHAREKRNLGVERISELMGVTDDALYKWLSNGRMPASLIPAFEVACGIHLVTEYLASGARRIVVEIPRGAKADEKSINQFQADLATMMGLLIDFYNASEVDADADAVALESALTTSLRSLAWHRINVAKVDQPELDLFAGEQQ